MRMIGLAVLAGLLAGCGDEAPTVGAAAAATSTASAASEPSGQERFRDWLAVCDNVGTCYAFGPASQGTGWVRIAMAAGPSAAPSVAFGFWPEDGTFGGAVKTEIDGVIYDVQVNAGNGEDDAPVVDASPGRARALVDAMAQGQVMSLSAGDETVPMSLAGAAASLLWIDERQGRLGTTTALIRKGQRPASAVPAAPPTPRVVAAPTISQRGYGDQEGQSLPAAIEALPAVAECRAETAFNPALQEVISSARLDADTVLWGVPCGMGAYNFANAYFTTTPDGANPRRLTFPRAHRAPAQVLINSAYDPATRVIDAFNKGRGPSDCGQMESWTWTAQGFVLTAASEMSECWGVPQAYWPASWVSQ